MRPQKSTPAVHRGRTSLVGLVLGVCVGLLLFAQQAGADGTSSVTQVLWFFGAPQTDSFIGVGDTVQWLWHDTLNHSVEGVGDAQGMFQGLGGGANTIAQKGFIYSYTFTTTGLFSYRCNTHPFLMFGSVNVKPTVNFGGVTLQWFLGASYGSLSAVVCQGDTVQWQWADDLTHGIEALDNDTSVFTGKGTNADVVSDPDFVYKKKFGKPGVYNYKCHNHGLQMQGRITVVAKGKCLQPPPLALKPPPQGLPPQNPPPKKQTLPPPAKQPARSAPPPRARPPPAKTPAHSPPPPSRPRGRPPPRRKPKKL